MIKVIFHKQGHKVLAEAHLYPLFAFEEQLVMELPGQITHLPFREIHSIRLIRKRKDYRISSHSE